jgi:hypothetical protein
MRKENVRKMGPGMYDSAAIQSQKLKKYSMKTSPLCSKALEPLPPNKMFVGKLTTEAT